MKAYLGFDRSAFRIAACFAVVALGVACVFAAGADSAKTTADAASDVERPHAGPRENRPCRITAVRGSQHQVFQGRLASMSGDWIVLTHVDSEDASSEVGVESEPEMLSKIPYTSRLFKNVGVARKVATESREVWIPRDAVLAVEFTEP